MHAQLPSRQTRKKGFSYTQTQVHFPKDIATLVLQREFFVPVSLLNALLGVPTECLVSLLNALPAPIIAPKNINIQCIFADFPWKILDYYFYNIQWYNHSHSLVKTQHTTNIWLKSCFSFCHSACLSQRTWRTVFIIPCLAQCSFKEHN